MSSGRRSARREAVIILYQRDLLQLDAPAALLRIIDVEPDEYTRALVLGVADKQESIDAVLEKYLTDWSLDRLGTLERSILRLATYELLWETDVPEAVVLDEAVELAKRFCSDEAGALVNGILGSLTAAAKERSGEGA